MFESCVLALFFTITGGLLLGLPLFFTACNFTKTNFCPRYNQFTGIIKKINYDNDYSIEQNLRRLQPPPVRQDNKDDSYIVWYYAYNYEYNKWCHIKCEQTSKDYKPCKNLNLGDGVNWYQFKKKTDQCERAIVVEERWWTGLMFLLLPALNVLIVLCIITMRYFVK